MSEEPSERYSPASAHVAAIEGSSAKKAGYALRGSPALGRSERQSDSCGVDSGWAESGIHQTSAASAT